MSHTPGPWSVMPTPEDQDHTHKIMYDCVQEWRRIGTVAGVFAKDNGEAEANARLLAAAPDLYDALRWVPRACHVNVGGMKAYFISEKRWAAITAALALAEGTHGKDRRVD
jgi:hypothetical protein